MDEVRLTAVDSGKSIQVGLGDQVVIRLGENPTTGFAWAVGQIDPEVMKLIGSDYEPASDSGIGGGGERIFTFTAIKAGSSPIQLKLWRKWEGDKSIRQRFQVTIEVHD